MVSATVVTFIQRAVMQGIPLLYGSTGEIITEKSGNLNLGIPGIMYVGGISGVIGAFLYENSLNGAAANGFLAIIIPLVCSILGSLIMGLIYSFLTTTLRANQNVTGLAITTFGTGFGNFFGGSLIKITGSDVPSVTLTTTSNFFRTKLPGADTTGWFGKVFLSYGFLAYAAVIIAIIVAVFLSRTRGGLHHRAVGENPATADAAGINVDRTKYLATCIGSVIAGLGGLYYVLDYNQGIWATTGQIEALGWLAVALVIFTTWKTLNAIWGSYLFGMLYWLYQFLPTLIGFSVPGYITDLIQMVPYLVTIAVLIVTSLRKKREDQPPASLGLAYFREER